MRQAVAFDNKLNSHASCINELTLEQQSALQDDHEILSIPLFVVLHLIEFLCNRHIDTTLAPKSSRGAPGPSPL